MHRISYRSMCASIIAVAADCGAAIRHRLAAARSRLRPRAACPAYWNDGLLKDLGLGHGDEYAIGAGLYEGDATRRRR
ncbi:hypothetical protein [Noviherbaspirillum aridicola]|nr:hypothetical protein [Noviherbaspirillum aridicola]